MPRLRRSTRSIRRPDISRSRYVYSSIFWSSVSVKSSLDLANRLRWLNDSMPTQDEEDQTEINPASLGMETSAPLYVAHAHKGFETFRYAHPFVFKPSLIAPETLPGLWAPRSVSLS